MLKFIEQRLKWTKLAFSAIWEKRFKSQKRINSILLDALSKFNYSEYSKKIKDSQLQSDYNKTAMCTFNKGRLKGGIYAALQPCFKKHYSGFRRNCIVQIYLSQCDDYMKCLVENNWQNKNPESLRIMHKQCLHDWFAKFMHPYIYAFESVDTLYKQTNRQLTSDFY